MWLEEAPFELKDFSPAVSSLRQEREAFSGVFKSNLFKDVGRIYISSQCRVARTDLRELVVLAGGRLVNTARVAEGVVGELHQKSNDVPNSMTVAGLRFSRDGSLLAVPRAGSGEVEVLGRDISWGRVGKVKLDNLQQKEMVTCLDWGNKASYIIAATSKVCTVPFSLLCF